MPVLIRLLIIRERFLDVAGCILVDIIFFVIFETTFRLQSVGTIRSWSCFLVIGSLWGKYGVYQCYDKRYPIVTLSSGIT